MQYTIEKLMRSDEPVQQYFVAAREKWQELLSDITTVSVQALAERLTHRQMWFENNCGSRWPGQEVMAWSAFGFLYSTHVGFDENKEAAKKLAAAFQTSMCSIEVKGHARDAASSYHVNET